jgi:hypothetical protein
MVHDHGSEIGVSNIAQLKIVFPTIVRSTPNTRNRSELPFNFDRQPSSASENTNDASRKRKDMETLLIVLLVLFLLGGGGWRFSRRYRRN